MSQRNAALLYECDAWRA